MNNHYIIGIDEAGRGAWAGPIVAGGVMIHREFSTDLPIVIPGIKDSKKLKRRERENIFSTIEYLSDKGNCQFTFAYRDADIIDAVGIREANRSCMEDIILSFLQFIEVGDTVEIWIDGCDNYTFAVEDFQYRFAKKKRNSKKGGGYTANEGSGVKHCLSDDDNLKIDEQSEKERDGFTLETFGAFSHKSTGEVIQLGKERNISYLINGDNLHPLISLGGIIAKVVRDRIMCEYSEDFPLYSFDEHVGYGTRKHSDALHNYNITPIHRKSYAPVKRLISEVSSI